MNRLSCALVAATALLLGTPPASGQTDACATDVDGDGIVGGADLTVVLNDWGSCQQCAGDVNGDGAVDGIDLATVLTRWGGTCAPTVTSITPTYGREDGGTEVVLTGAHLLRTTAVLFGGVPAAQFTVINQFTVAAITPPSSPGYADVSLVSLAGATTAPSAFRFGVEVPVWSTLIQAAPSAKSVPDANFRAAIEQTGLAWHVRDTQSQIEMLLVPPGEYVRGASSGDQDASGNESPPHVVTITRAFYMGRYEVMQSEYLARTGVNPSYWINPQGPVARVTWHDANNFAASLSLRLPTEAEWEYACRAGVTGPRYGPLDEVAWYYQNSGATQTVGTKSPNPLGFFDMLGNAREWVYDWWGVYLGQPLVDPVHIMNEPIHVVRGGSVAYGSFSAATCRASWRRDYVTTYSDGDLGFRVARNP
jgi:formylglycine-generating enzyme required for sulfatase activity